MNGISGDKGKALCISGVRCLHAADISFSEDLVQNGHLLEFYMEICFDADAVFGTHVCTTENDDYLNVYANYDLSAGNVCDTLDVFLMQANGDEQDYKYRLSMKEKELLLPKMQAYCQKLWGIGLEECRQQYFEESSAPQTQPVEPTM